MTRRGTGWDDPILRNIAYLAGAAMLTLIVVVVIR